MSFSQTFIFINNAYQPLGANVLQFSNDRGNVVGSQMVSVQVPGKGGGMDLTHLQHCSICFQSFPSHLPGPRFLIQSVIRPQFLRYYTTTGCILVLSRRMLSHHFPRIKVNFPFKLKYMTLVLLLPCTTRSARVSLCQRSK